ncbi:hypothetical protein lpp2374 [Legionella pneumophila str. Paris]|nr:hypothetical protein lpp2374 [Legionella pneumophila str. Paris]
MLIASVLAGFLREYYGPIFTFWVLFFVLSLLLDLLFNA